MTTAPYPPAPAGASFARAARRTSKVEQSRQVLLGTAAIVSTVLVLWMLLAPAFAPARRPPFFLAASLGAPASLPDLSSIMAADGQALASRTRASTQASPGRAGFQQSLDDLLARRGTAPIVIYLSVVGASGPSDAEGTRAYVVTADGTSGARGGFVSVADLVGPLQESKGPPKLLILDPGPIASDRDLGVFGNGFLAQLAPLLRRDGNLAVLTACAPGQVSWIAEPDHRSVFAHFVAEGLSGKAARWGKVTVQGLHRYVRAEVSRWARRHRDAAQSPMLLGNDALDFPLPRFDIPPRPLAPDPKQVAELRDTLKTRWTERATLAATHPYRHVPLAWRAYEASLLSAERLLRAGDLAGASKALDAARSARARVESDAPGPQHPRPHSLALAEAWNGAEAAAPRIDAYRRAIDHALGATGDAPKNPDTDPPSPDRKPEPSPAPAADPAAKADAPDQEKETEAKPAGEDGAAPAKAPADTKPARSTKPPAEPKPARPKPAADSPIGDDLTGGSPDGTPTFVEGQLALWYSTFTARGGESDALRVARLNGLRRASAARAKAERAAADERAVAWVRDLVDEGDRARREAQDRLFAAESAPFKDCAPRLASAEALYDRAASTAAQCRRALDLVQRLEDDLPYLGDWQSRRPEGIDETFDALLDDAADLARLLFAGPGRPDGAEDARRRLAALTDKTDQGYTRLTADFRAAVDRALGRSAAPSWRELDALLRVPDIAPDDRLALLDRLAATAPAAIDEPLAASSDDETSPPDPDPSFWKQARALAHLESGLLELAGFDVQDLTDWQAQAWAARERNPELAFESFNRVSARVRELRAQVLSDSRGPAASSSPSESEGPAERTTPRVGRDLGLADRAARILTATLASRLTGDPPRQFDEYLLQALLVWHGRRLDDDFAPEHAERILEDARRFGGSQALWDELGRARKLAAAALTVTGPGTGPDAAAHRDITLRVTAEADVPPGEAAVLLGHDPAVPMRTAVAAPGSLISLPTDSGKPAARTATVTPLGGATAVARLDLAPGVFYRGRIYTSEKITLAEQDEIVRVEIRQQRLLKGMPDLFLRNAGKGYLHTLNSLDYKLVITNLTDRPVDAHVTYALEGLPTDEARIHLDPHKSNETVKGKVYPSDVPDNKARLLTVNVNEADPDGRALCKPFIVPFRKVHPKEFILADPGLGGGHFFVWVTHLDGTDPVPLPAEVLVKVEPANAFQEVGSSFKLVPHGKRARFLFRIVKPVDSVKWTVKAEGVENVHSGELQMETGRPLPGSGPVSVPVPGG